MKNIKNVSALAMVLGLVSLSSVYAYTPLTTQIGLGSRGNNVTNLQTFFADNNSIYPSGLVTGYFGGMTKTAVQKFQANYGFAQVGRVGPQTLSKVNQLINGGGWGTNNGNNAGAAGVSPTFYSVNRSVTSNSATFSWVTDENVNSKVFYSTSPVTVNEGDMDSRGFALINGSVANSNNAAGLSQQVTINNLQSNTLYYYMLVSTDASGNVSVHSINSTFRTN